MHTKDKINIVTSLNVGMKHRINLVLLLLGFKQAISIPLYAHNDKAHTVKKILEKSGLFFLDFLPEEEGEIWNLTVALTEKAAWKLQSARYKKDLKTISRLDGWPETSVHALDLEDEWLIDEFYPEDLKYNPISVLLSVKGHQSEIALVRSWMAQISTHSPELYDSMKEFLQAA